jgi:hypothetical protein
LTARLDRLGSAREVAQIGAVIGRDFSYKLLREITGIGDAPRRWSFTKEISEMLTCKNKERLDPAQVAAGFRDQLAQLVEQAQGDGATFHALVDALDAQIVRLRMHDAATRPWKLKKKQPGG